MCPLVFFITLAVLLFWWFRRWLSIQQSKQRILEKTMERLPEPVAEVRRHRHDDPIPYIEGNVLNDGYQVTTPEDKVPQWLDEVKDELSNNDEKEKDDDGN